MQADERHIHAAHVHCLVTQLAARQVPFAIGQLEQHVGHGGARALGADLELVAGGVGSGVQFDLLVVFSWAGPCWMLL